MTFESGWKADWLAQAVPEQHDPPALPKRELTAKLNHRSGLGQDGATMSFSACIGKNIGMPLRKDIVNFHEPSVPDGLSPYVPGAGPAKHIEIVEWSEAWTGTFQEIAERIQTSLGWRALVIEHVGSTSVRGLPAKPIIDIDLIVADPNDESSYVPALEDVGFELRVREPWWFGHRVLRTLDPACNLHIFGYDSPETVKHRIFRDWLRANPDDRQLYADTKLKAATLARDAGEHSMQYNARKADVIREIYHRAFAAMGLIVAGPRINSPNQQLS